MPIRHREDQPSSDSRRCSGPAVSITALNYHYPDGHHALKDINLEIEACDKAALVGPNGAGKSTLMLQLNGVLQGKGELEIMGLPVTEDNLPSIRSRIGLVFQNPDDQLFSPTVFEDVAFGPLHMGLPEGEIHRRVEHALEQVGMAEYADRLSYHLSLGEKKRIAIATVLSMQPDILVFDEPTSGLDPRARRALIDYLQDWDLTLLVSTHDMRLVEEVFPRTVVMDQGRIVADAPTEDILADAALLERHGLEKP